MTTRDREEAAIRVHLNLMALVIRLDALAFWDHVIPHLSCWERQAEGVDDGAQRSEARLDGLDVRRREQVQPGQEQAGTDVGLEQQAEVVEGGLSPRPRCPGRVGLQ